VRILVERGADVNLKDHYGSTVLINALARRQTDIVQLLLDHHAQVNGAVDINGRTPLMVGIAAVPALWEPPSKPHNGLGIKLLEWWVHRGHAFNQTVEKAFEIKEDIARVQLLLDHKAETQVADHNGQTPITLAAVESHALLVKALLDQGADPNQRDRAMGNATALILAVKVGNTPMIKTLLAKGADPSLKDDFKKDAIAYADQSGIPEIVELMKRPKRPLTPPN
jgi:ankyrin repeat protein